MGGWATWLVGAVDPRVMAIVPVVMDELNFLDNIKHHYRSLGGWSFALESYWKMNLTLYFNDPALETLFAIIDPFQYKDKLKLPKLVCNSADDEFFLPDNIRYWWDQMPLYQQMNRFITLPFSEHTTIPGTLELLGAINTWLREMLTASAKLGTRPAPTSMEERNEDSARLMEAASVPVYNWTISETGEEIIVMADRKPLKVNMWHSSTCHAHANTRKDFRLVNNDSPCTCGVPLPPPVGHCGNLAVLWYAWELQETEPGSLTWVAHMPAPTGVSGRLSLWISNSRDLNQQPQTRHLVIPLVTMELLSSRRRYRLYLTRSPWRIALATNVWEALCSLHGPPKHKYTS